METLKIGEIATLDDGKEFICCSQVVNDGINYVYLLSNYKPLEVRFAKQIINNQGQLELTMINQQEEKVKVLQLFNSLNK